MDSVDAKILRQMKNLAGFSETHLKKLAANLSVVSAAKNQIVFDQGDDAKLVYLLLSGVAKLSYLSRRSRKADHRQSRARGRVFWSRFADSADASSFQVRSV